MIACITKKNQNETEEDNREQWNEEQKKVLEFIRQNGPAHVKDLQAATRFKSRAQFLKEVLNPLLESGVVFREGNSRSPASTIVLR